MGSHFYFIGGDIVGINEYINELYGNDPYWFIEEVNRVYHKQRIDSYLDIKEYLSGKHAILNRTVEMYNGKEFSPRKIVLQYAKTILNFSTNYLLGNPLTLTGSDSIVKEFQRVSKKGKYNNLNVKILDKLLKYGDVFEYVYVDDNKVIKSKIINPEDSYPIYDDNKNYIAFIESYTTLDYITYYTVYYEDKVQQFTNKGNEIKLTGEWVNLSGLPIVYKTQNELDDCFGRSDLDDLITILDSIEDLLSKYTDALYRHINPIPVVIGQQLKGDGINPHIVGSGLTLDDGSDFKMIGNQMDYMSFQTLYKTLTGALLDIANVPAVSMSKTDISNLSEVSIKLLFSLADIKAKVNEQYLREGFEERFEKIKTILQLQGKRISEDSFDTLDMVFQYARPTNEKEIIDNLKTLADMKGISLESIVEHSPYTHDVQQEINRIRNSIDTGGGIVDSDNKSNMNNDNDSRLDDDNS